jgi:hypothetical protein
MTLLTSSSCCQPGIPWLVDVLFQPLPPRSCGVSLGIIFSSYKNTSPLKYIAHTNSLLISMKNSISKV